MTEIGISALSTESAEVARIVAAHNAVAHIITQYAADTAGGAADLYVTMFHKVYAAIRDTAPLPGVSAP
jgi:hypothetical protein